MFARRPSISGVVVVVVLGLAGLACTLSQTTTDSTASLQTRPVVLLLAPVNGSLYAEGTLIQFQAVALDANGQAARLQFRVDDAPLAEVTATSAAGQSVLEGRTAWTASGQRGHLLTVEAFRADGSSMGLNDVTIHVMAQPGGGAVVASETPAFTPIPTLTPAPTSPPVPLSGPVAVIAVSQLNVRQGPGTEYATVGTLVQGDRVQIVGRNADATWWAVSFGGGTAWVFAELTTTEGDVSQVPLVAAP